MEGFEHLQMPVGWESIPAYTHVEFLMDFPDTNKVARQKMYLVPPHSEYLTLKEGDIVEYDQGHSFYAPIGIQKKEKFFGIARVVKVDKFKPKDELEKVVIRLESIP